MAVRIYLDNPNPVYSNLDIISGKAVLSLNREEAFTAIVVKLECESKTKLASPRSDGRRDYDVELEVHKLLYQTLNVFPSPNLVQATVKGASYTLPPGQHPFPFQFKFPFNNSCTQMNSATAIHQDFNRHVKKTLPPSLSGFPGEAEIRYYVKVTAQRTAFYKENFRNEVNFRFLPIEPPRPPPNKRESYARRQHQFAPPISPGPQKSGMFRRSSANSTSGPPPRVSIDGRLPDPAIITCNEPLPLRVLLRKLNETSELLYLHMFQIVLIGFTKIRAHDLERVEQSSWVIASYANLRNAIDNFNTPVDKDIELDKSMWNTRSLPNTVPPSFETCNIMRYYELEISIGLTHGTPGNMKPELTVQPLRMPVQVFSGVRPPDELLKVLRQQGTVNNLGGRPYADTLASTSIHQTQFAGQSPLTSPNSTQHVTPIAHPTSFGMSAEEDAPPPSYEDAMAEDLAPVDGQRRDYEHPVPMVTPDEKRTGLFGNSS